jgi:hypothetical protein
MERGLIIWCGAYLLTFWLGAMWGNWFEHNQVGAVSSAGFVGALLGWAGGAFSGALVSAWVTSPGAMIRSVIFALAWGLSFLGAGYVGLVAGMVLGEVSKNALVFLSKPQIALAIGWGLGSALGGLLASALGMAAWRALISPSAGVTKGR